MLKIGRGNDLRLVPRQGATLNERVEGTSFVPFELTEA
jgi:hypothetical protein